MIIPLICVCALYPRPEGRGFTAQADKTADIIKYM